MSWLTGQQRACTYICPEHKYVAKASDSQSYMDNIKLDVQRSFVCPTCRKPLINMGDKWRAPKKLNIRAWNKINAGNIWWDSKAQKYIKRNVSTEYRNDFVTKWFLKQRAERDD